jgi:hypothetical protein
MITAISVVQRQDFICSNLPSVKISNWAVKGKNHFVVLLKLLSIMTVIDSVFLGLCLMQHFILYQ